MATVENPVHPAALPEDYEDIFQRWLDATRLEAPADSSSASPADNGDHVQDEEDVEARWERWLAATELSPADASRQHSLPSYWSTAEIQGAAASPLHTPSSSASEYSCVAVQGTPLDAACSTGTAPAPTPHTATKSASVLDLRARATSTAPSPVDLVLQLMLDQGAPSLAPEGSYELPTPARNLHRAGFGSCSSDEEDDEDDDDDGARSCASNSSDESISLSELAALGVVDLDTFTPDPTKPLVRQLVDLLVNPREERPAAVDASA